MKADRIQMWRAALLSAFHIPTMGRTHGAVDEVLAAAEEVRLAAEHVSNFCCSDCGIAMDEAVKTVAFEV